MGQLLVRNLEADIVRALKVRAAKNGRSAEEEHREILRAALGQREYPTIKDWILAIPVDEDGEDFSDCFERQRDLPRDIDLLGDEEE